MAIWRRVERRLDRAGLKVRTELTGRRGEATTLARRAADAGAQTVLAVGGDGTAHEVVNGLLADGVPRDDVRFGLVAAGTGMDLARNLETGRGLDRLTARIIAGEERRIDIGRAVDESGEPLAFLNFAETGLGAAVVAREAGFSSRWPGRLSFFLASVAATLENETLRCAVLVDGRRAYEGPLVSVVVANGRYVGGGMKIAPAAAMDDGLLDVLILGDFTRPELLTQIWKIYPGIHVSHDKVLWVRGHEVEIVPGSPTRLDLDGELYGGGPYTVSVLPRALRVLV